MTDKQIIKKLAESIKNLKEQLKRKEQEYEELRQYHNKCCIEFKKEKQELLEKYNQVSRDFYNGKYCNKENCSLLNAKEQECKELKNCLTEIKEIVNGNYEILDPQAKNEILQKISECEVYKV